MLEDKLKKQRECIKLLSKKLGKEINEAAIIWSERYAKKFNDIYSQNSQLNYYELYNLATELDKKFFEGVDDY